MSRPQFSLKSLLRSMAFVAVSCAVWPASMRWLRVSGPEDAVGLTVLFAALALSLYFRPPGRKMFIARALAVVLATAAVAAYWRYY